MSADAPKGAPQHDEDKGFRLAMAFLRAGYKSVTIYGRDEAFDSLKKTPWKSKRAKRRRS